MINLLLIRDTFSKDSTIGELFLNGERICDTLENPYLDNQRNISCIPEGEYPVRLRLARESASRDYLHLLVQEVPNRDWILFHRGNYPKDTSGCILVGLANSTAIGLSLGQANQVLTVVSLSLAIAFTIYKFIKFDKKK